MRRLPALILTALCISECLAPAQEELYREFLDSGLKYLQTGKLSRARREFTGVIADYEEAKAGDERPSQSILRACRQNLLRIDLIVGNYQAVLAEIEGLEPAERETRSYSLLAAQALWRRGQSGRVKAVLERLLVADPNDLQARCLLGELELELGQTDGARKNFAAIVDLASRKSLRSGEDLGWVARARMDLGTREDFEQASMLLVEAIRVAPDLPSPRILYGKLRFAAYGEWSKRQSGETILKQVLERNGDVEEALVALYRIRKSNHKLDPAKTDSYLRRALELNPNSVPAMLERGIQRLDDRRFAAGAEILDKALGINPNDQMVLAQRAAAAYLVGDDDAATRYRQRILGIHANSVAADIALGDRLVRLYRFADSVSYYQAALEKQPDEIAALDGLGRALIYTGQGEQAGKVLQHAEELQAGIVNPWRFNALAIEELLGKEYQRVETEGFVFRVPSDQRVVLEHYLVPVMTEARQILGEKYGYVPDYPVEVEVLRTWDDFSVRTIGFRGFTALGACFGPMITLVSPGDQDLRKQDFMWTATAWHEFAHVLTLALSANRIPRWLTEGISVYEEGARNKSWERGMDRELLSMYRNGDIPPVHLLNGLFRGPRILEGYYLGGQIVDYLSGEFGFDKVVSMLRFYAEDLSTEEAFRRAFGITTQVFDSRFLTYVKEEKLASLILQPHFGPAAVEQLRARLAKNPGDLRAHIDIAWAYLQRGVEVDAANQLREVFVVDPEHALGKLLHAELLRRRGAIAEAMEAYSQGFDAGADDFDSRISYGKLLTAAGDLDGAARQFLAAKRCWPKCTDQAVAPSLLLAKLYGEAGREAEAMMELTTFCSRTGRAFQPRIELAAYARKEGDRRQEVRLLEEAIQIDPFARSVHRKLADAYLAQARKAEAMRELEMALQIDPKLDRANLGKNPSEVPGPTDAEFLGEQAGICLRLAKGLHDLGRLDRAIEYLQRAVREAPQSASADEARDLLEQWR